jgi:hypothetical protein
MRATTWAVFGSLFINLVLGLLIAALFSVAPLAQAAEPAPVHCAHGVHTKQAPERAAPPAPTRRAYLVDVRMGWAPGG